MYERELVIAESAARQAAAAILDLYNRSAAATYTKGDGSPVTDADLAADRIIRSHLSTALPADAILTEEGIDDTARLAASRCWIVDPIDGTHQFVERTGEFDVLIALVENGRPVLGVMLQPTTGLMLSAAAGAGAWREENGIRLPLNLVSVAAYVAPRLVTSIWLGAPENLPSLARVSNRLGGREPVVSRLGVTVRNLVPPGDEADVLIGFRPSGDHTMAWEWDLAAADAIVHEAGGVVSNVWGNPICYNKPHPRNTGGIILSVDPLTHERVVRALAPELAGTAS